MHVYFFVRLFVCRSLSLYLSHSLSLSLSLPIMHIFVDNILCASSQTPFFKISDDLSLIVGQDYFQNHHGDWLAVDYKAKQREDLGQHFKVEGIPSHLTTTGGFGDVLKDLRKHQDVLWLI